jgi:hypothetical protein
MARGRSMAEADAAAVAAEEAVAGTQSIYKPPQECTTGFILTALKTQRFGIQE